jgi:hypothetical protein
MKKTAVEWLIEHLNLDETSPNYNKLIIDQALEMDKDHIKNAWLNSLTKGDYNSADEYYNETFKIKHERNTREITKGE